MLRLARWIATGCGLGYAPVASGTVASAAAAVAWYILPLGEEAQWVLALLAALLGWWAADAVAKQAGDPDPSIVVIDELAGMWLALAGLPHTVPVVCAAFLLFRVLDIGKFPPMKQLERLPGGIGIMLDDVAAGLISRAILGVTLAAL